MWVPNLYSLRWSWNRAIFWSPHCRCRWKFSCRHACPMPLGPTHLGFICPKLWFISKITAGVVVNSAINTKQLRDFAPTTLGVWICIRENSDQAKFNGFLLNHFSTGPILHFGKVWWTFVRLGRIMIKYSAQLQCHRIMATAIDPDQTSNCRFKDAHKRPRRLMVQKILQDDYKR